MRFISQLAVILFLAVIILIVKSISVMGGELLIFDVHSHSARGMKIEQIINRMDSSGVKKIVLFARRQGTDEEVLRLNTKFPEKVIPTIGFQNSGWLKQDHNFLSEVEAKLKSRRFRWMGELLLKHYGVPELQAPSFDISPDTNLFRKVLDFSAQYSIPITIHHEAEPGNIEIFYRSLKHNLDALVVWAHWLGRATPEVAQKFLKQFPNLYCDLGACQRSRRYGHEKNPIIGSNGELQTEWKGLIEAFPDRFLAAIDAVDPEHYNRYEDWVSELKKALEGLPTEVARKVVFENTERLLAKRKILNP